MEQLNYHRLSWQTHADFFDKGLARWLHWWNKDLAFAQPPCAGSLQKLAGSASQPKSFAVRLGELHLIDSGESTNEWNWDRDRLLEIFIFLACVFAFAPHICTAHDYIYIYISVCVSLYVFFSHQDASVSSIMFLQLSRSPPLSPSSTRFPTLSSSHPLSLSHSCDF